MVSTQGMLYDYATATAGASDGAGRIRGICPEGWHIPDADELRALAPDREDVIGVWNFLRRAAPGGAELRDNTDRLCLQIAASSPRPPAARRAIACLEILAELGLVSLRRSGSAIAVRIVPHRTNPLENSVLFCTLRKLKAGD